VQAGEPVGLIADLRHASSKAEERRTLDLIEAREDARLAVLDERQGRLRDDLARGEALEAHMQDLLDHPELMMSGSVSAIVGDVDQGLPPGSIPSPGPVPVTGPDIDDPHDMQEGEPAEHTEPTTETDDDWLL
jgi:hypothetical protein